MRPIDITERRWRRIAERRGIPSSLPHADVFRLLESYFEDMRKTVAAMPLADLARVAEEMLRARAGGKTVYVLGNGGSAATASHAATDWRKPAHDNADAGLKAVSLVDNFSLLTAWANDTSFDNVFAAQLESSLTPGDVVIAVSGSGNSPNVLRAVETARRMGAITVGFAGSGGGSLARLVDICVAVPSDDPPLIEDMHLAVSHALRGVLRQPAVPDTEDIDSESAEEFAV